MSPIRVLSRALCVVGGVLLFANPSARGQSLVPAQAPSQPASGSAARDLFVTVGKSLIVESPVHIQRVSVGDATRAEAMAVTPREVLVNGKAPGETSLIIWQQGGNRLMFDLRVQPSTMKLEAVREEIRKELPSQDVSLTVEGANVFLRGTVADLVSAERAASIAGTLGKTVNLLRVKTPPIEEQILLKVRFANVDRVATQELGVNFFSTGAGNTPGTVTTGQFTPPRVDVANGAGSQGTQVTLTDALNVFLFRPDLNLGATIRALQSRRMLEILAEPNLLAINGKQASFLAGGEFPVPVVQSGVGGAGAVTIQWREFGIRINFLPAITPRGTIRLRVAPEVSSLDYNNALVITGFTVPAISSRKVQTEIELENGQSFAIAGLLDNRVTESLSKVPGLGDIPLLGKLFQSRAISKNNSELLVVVTPELVHPAQAGQAIPGVKMPQTFVQGASAAPPRTPPVSVTGVPTGNPLQETVPVEQLQEPKGQGAPAQPMPAIQLIPMPVAPQPAAGTTPGAPAAPDK